MMRLPLLSLTMQQMPHLQQLLLMIMRHLLGLRVKKVLSLGAERQ